MQLFFYFRKSRLIAIWILFIVAGFCSYFINTYSILIDSGMIRNAVSTDINETLGLLSFGMFLKIIITAIIPCLFISKISIIESTHKAKITTLLITITLSVVLVFTNYINLASFFRQNKTIPHQISPSNFFGGAYFVIKNSIKSKSIATEIDTNASISKNFEKPIVVFVVGETARRANFEIYGYGKKTNPILSTLDIIKIPNTTSCGTNTNVSVPCMFSPDPRTKFVDGTKEYLTQTLARASVQTYWIENNFGGCYGVCKDLKTVKRFSGAPDGNSLPELKEMLNQAQQGSFIVFHQNGSHGPLYKDRITKDFEKFQPACTITEVSKCTKEELVNSYDNTILYTDWFLSQIIKEIDKTNKNIIFLYVSDHGESLGEYGLFLHGFPYNLAPKEQKEVPFVIYMSKKYQSQNQGHKNCLKKVKSASHDNIYHTIAGLFKLNTKFYNKDLDLVSNCGNETVI
jgi:lipid A ethanolaminephosphotransferase